MGAFARIKTKEIKPLYDRLGEDKLENFFFPYLQKETYPFPASVVLNNGQLLDGHKRIVMADLFGIKPIVYIIDAEELLNKNAIGMNEEELFTLRVRYGHYENGLRSYFDNIEKLRKNHWFLNNLNTAKKYFHMKSLNLI